MSTAVLAQALAHHRQGNFAAAEQGYAAAIKADPRNFQAHHLLGTLRMQQGRFADALASLDRAIGAKPDFADAHGSRGLALCNLQRFQEAVQSFGKALKLKPRAPDILAHRALALYYLKKPEQAVASYDESLAFEPRNPDAQMARANILMELKRHAEALAGYDAALALRPNVAEVVFNRGMLLAEMNRPAEALAAFDHAVALKPGLGAAHYNRGLAYARLGRSPEALAAYDKAIALDAGYVQAWNDRGLALKALRRFDEALASFDRALALKPDFAGAWNNLGNTLWDMARTDDAARAFGKAIELRPDFALPYRNRAGMLAAHREHYSQAVADFAAALRLDPSAAYVRGELLHMRMMGADWTGLAQEMTAIDAGVRAGQEAVMPFVYQAISESPADLKACAQIYARQYPAAPRPAFTVPRRPGRIRLGYLCGEFRSHATSYLTAGLFEHHDRERFEVVAFDNGRADDSDTRRRLEKAFDRMIPIAGMGAAQAAGRIAHESIDILVNLNGYYGAGRTDVFAERPAPVQVNFLGFPGTLGADYIDYIVADRVVIPESERMHYVEKVAYLPGCYQANDARRGRPDIAATRAAQGLPEDAFVFCYFNHAYKLAPAMFASWMRILTQTAGSVLWLLDSRGNFAANIRAAAAAQGVDPARIVFAPVDRHAPHLARLALGDLFLDSLPYNAHTTASDALWMGLPLLTCRGTTFPGRVAASLLTAANLPELITESLADYETRAVEIARDPARLAALKAKLKDIGSTPLFDTAGYTRALEALYGTMLRDVNVPGTI
ncbi:MAG: tetratricopeptide repeat protein [Rhodospirillaceae bacterium]|nr:tetratricopeptide repeat protein [Rhodospirillaceae bacterium]